MAPRKNLIRLLLTLFLCATFYGCQFLKNFDLLPSNQRGVYHTVKQGQTLYFIARAYNINVNRLQRVNRVHDPTKIKIGARLWIPGARKVLEVDSRGNNRKIVKRKGRRKNVLPRKGIKVEKGFLIWPLKGQLTSKFGNRNGRHHDGIDIGARKGTPIFAAADGKVMFSGWGPTGYGKMIIIRHKKNLTTVYAHNLHNHVHKNQIVKKGQRIASVGNTGRSTGPHLHFEVRNESDPQNPLNYLSKQ